MKYLMYVIGLLLTPSIAWGMNISDYYVDLEIQDNASVLVSEKITYVHQTNQDQSITHIIPLRYSLANGKRQAMKISNIKAVINENPVDVQHVSDEKKTQITVPLAGRESAGTTNVEISYEADGAIGYYENYNEIRWPLFTHTTDSEIDLIAASVRIPSQFRALRADCIATREDKEYNCNVPSRLEGGYVSYFAHMGARAGDEVFVSTQFDTGVEVTVRSVSWNWIEWAMAFAVLLFVLGVLLVGFLYSKTSIKKYFTKRGNVSEK